MNAVTFHEVSFSYDSLAPEGEGTPSPATEPALRDLSYVFKPGSATLLTGPSGCGKSTVLRLINGLIPHVNGGDLTGEVTVDGLDTISTTLTELGSRTATVFQNPANQFFTATVGEELAFGLQQAGIEHRTIIDAVTSVADRLGLGDRLERMLDQLSGGEQQQVACGVALIGGATILLFDEPTSNLSPTAIEDIAVVLRELKAGGATLIIAEHRLYFLNGIVDTVLLFTEAELRSCWDADSFFALDDQTRRDLGLRCLDRPELGNALGGKDSEDIEGLKISDVSFNYGDRPVLRIADLLLPAGQVTAVMGPNGAGKSTLCRLITGLAEPASGTISWAGMPLARKERISTSALVMQDVHRQLFAETVLAEVTTGMSKDKDIDADQVLAELDLLSVADRHPMSLSGGQKQRLVIATVMVKGSRVVVLDEPTSGVDYRHLCDITRLARRLTESGAAVVVVSHDIEFVASCADRVVTLSPLGDEPHNHIQLTLLNRELPAA